ncbi:BMP-binding endothelial regulator protein-like isoform X2 [Tachypleus tridentatus]|uniref:BMP-binding endothelial regulator protein-like isoform X2 n=1 Tax=Tachypleus tridentatus TaxID=6853 RepID=UPI003FD49CF2
MTEDGADINMKPNDQRSTMVRFIVQTVIIKITLIMTLNSPVSGSIIEGRPITCKVEGEEIKIPFIAKEQCISCRCQNKRIVCNEKCPSEQRKDCYFLLYDQKQSCCDICKGCSVNGTIFESGFTWTDPNDPCLTFSCESGVVTKARIHCHIPCRNHLPPASDECCPSCKGCTVGGRSYSDNQEIEVTQADPCVQCNCKKGNIVCIKKACPVLPCPESKYITKPGECCPTCRGNRKIYDFNGRCLVGMTSIRHKQKIALDHCTHCTCDNATTICQRTVCPPVHCPPEFQELLPDQCCYRCREPEESKAVCMVSGHVYQDKETWKKDRCTSCSCHDGQIVCAVMECSHPSCPKRHRRKILPGECCPTCVEDDAVCSVFGDPHYRTFDGRIFNFQGSCKYLLAKDCNGNKSFSIQVINDPRHSKSFSWTKVVKIKLGQNKIRMARFMKVKVNKKKVSLPYVKLGSFSIIQEGYSMVTRTNLGMKVMWDGGSFVEVSVPPEFKNHMCGLCGNYNNNPQDDFITRKGNIVSDVDIFGNFWQLRKNVPSWKYFSKITKKRITCVTKPFML